MHKNKLPDQKTKKFSGHGWINPPIWGIKMISYTLSYKKNQYSERKENKFEKCFWKSPFGPNEYCLVIYFGRQFFLMTLLISPAASLLCNISWNKSLTTTLTSSLNMTLRLAAHIHRDRSRDRKFRNFTIFEFFDFAKFSKCFQLVMMTAYRRGAPMPRGAGSSIIFSKFRSRTF